MSAIGRERRYPKSGMAEVAGLPRRQLLAVAVLMCVPVPLLTLGGLAVPFPELAQRALAPILPFVDSPGTPSASGAPASVRALPILADPADRSAGEDATANPVNDVRTRTSNADTVARTDPGGSPVRPAAADGASSPSGPPSSAAPTDTTEPTSSDGGSTDGGGTTATPTGTEPVAPQPPPPPAPAPPPAPSSPPVVPPPPPGPSPPPPIPVPPVVPAVTGALPEPGDLVEDPVTTVQATVDALLGGLGGKRKR